MLTPRDEALLHAQTVRELRTLLTVFQKELEGCHEAKRKHWLEVRIANIMGIIRTKLAVTG